MDRACIQTVLKTRDVSSSADHLLKTGQAIKGRRVRAYAGSGSGFAVPLRVQSR